jgi:S1-C subfamily serine protease
MNNSYDPWQPSNRSGGSGFTKALVAVVAVVALLITLAYVGLANSAGSSSPTTTVTSTKTSTILDAFTKTISVPAGNGSGSTIDPEQIYANTNESIVTVQGVLTAGATFGVPLESVLGSGFVVNYSNSYYIVTNYHVAGSTVNLTVTFADGTSYPAKVIGSDPYSDLAVVQASGVPGYEYRPLPIVSSSTLEVGQYVVAIGNPFGLARSMTFGIISQLGRTIQDPTAGNFSIANAIQFSAPINPGNSGGVLVDGNGDVVGITTAVVSGSQGVGFAIPSDTIIEELPYLITTGSYNLHAYLGISGVDMSYQLAQVANTNYTYGVLIEQTVSGGPAAEAGVRFGNQTVTIDGEQYLVGGDIIISINGTRIVDNDALATYLEENTISGQTAVLGIIRNGTYTTVDVILGTRPPISS